MMFSGQTVAALGISALLAIGIPVAAVIIFKIKVRDSWLPSAFIGAGTMLVFALILEQLLHTVMLPLVSGNTVLYCVYGVLAAGIFEETGRFVANKLFMKRHYSTKNAVLMGLGHGGFEAVALVGITALSYFITVIFVNAVGETSAVTMLTGGDSSLEQQITMQLNSMAAYNFFNSALAVYERIVTMAFHVCMSVWVYKAASGEGGLWPYPAAVLTHAAVDVCAVLYQVGLISVILTEILLTVAVAAVVFVTVRFTAKKKAR